jgi:beta-ureidopropionase
MSNQGQSKPVAPYMAIGLSTAITGIANRKHIRHNLENIEEAIHACISMTNINMPVKVIALAEGALTGFTDEIFDLPHTLAAEELFIDIPGTESEWLGRLAKLYNVHHRPVQSTLAGNHGQSIFQYAFCY